MQPENEKNKELNGFKMMQLSEEVKLILQKIRNYDKSNFAAEL